MAFGYRFCFLILVSETMKLFEHSLGELQAKVSVGKLPQVRATEIYLGRAIQNILSNAIKFRSDRQLEISFAYRVVDGMNVFSVTDNGMGFEPQHSQRI
jgi:signal transduction histidine kinase